MYKLHVEIGQYQFVEVEADNVYELKEEYDLIKDVFCGVKRPRYVKQERVGDREKREKKNLKDKEENVIPF